ncbi:hypothetical protein M9H77_10239 [Catharanthus roseus]|uniref:Uncharacterized protein n=1 Tax=Catharanthus roseus TaxID=4058 RepID=A0ACC0C385_CATRO|nr:hypothetical protein M9H77_10239 [Catharanthus roseus]
MRDKLLPRNAVFSALGNEFRSGFSADAAQSVAMPKLSSIEFVESLLERRWSLSSPESPVHEVTICRSGNFKQCGGEILGNTSFQQNPMPSLGGGIVRKTHEQPSFYVVRDDLLHPLINGNKARKLDALLPLLEDNAVTDVVTCGGCQSAHAAAVAISCAERGLKSHLLLRGEQPETLTGYNLISSLYGNVSYVERSLYARREDMLARHANSVAGSVGTVQQLDDFWEASFRNDASKNLSFPEMTVPRSIRNFKKVAVINEGASEAIGLLGVIRLVHCLSRKHLFGTDQMVKLVVDAGTGTTAVGLGLGALCLGLPWEVSAVMLADTLEGYRKREEHLISKFHKVGKPPAVEKALGGAKDKVVNWVDRSSPRKFGNVLKGEVQECQKIAQETGILVDPIYTLAAWELATQLSLEQRKDEKVVMLHTGGTLGMFGLAQRYKPYFQNLKDESYG